MSCIRHRARLAAGDLHSALAPVDHQADGVILKCLEEFHRLRREFMGHLTSTDFILGKVSVSFKPLPMDTLRTIVPGTSPGDPMCAFFDRYCGQ
jgi:hypothetical protein